MPDKHVPPSLFILLSTAIAGVLGAGVRQLASQEKSWGARLLEWLGGGVLAVYASPTVAFVVHHLLIKMDLIALDSDIIADDLLGLSGFLCGAVGISIIEYVLSDFKKNIDSKQ